MLISVEVSIIVLYHTAISPVLGSVNPITIWEFGRSHIVAELVPPSTSRFAYADGDSLIRVEIALLFQARFLDSATLAIKAN